MTQKINTALWNIIQTKDNCWRFVNHDLKQATAGFYRLDSLLKYADDFLDTERAKNMRLKRYAEFFGDIPPRN